MTTRKKKEEKKKTSGKRSKMARAKHRGGDKKNRKHTFTDCDTRKVKSLFCPHAV